ncbi:DJ-1/PfpI family protein [Saccharothrix sp. Mg75]|uniref:DJ-1/PfpI family protein n=1 Tax=Saccharothrix sp. Mg75 TaxID=3445357 RepID=UPI003EE8CE7B
MELALVLYPDMTSLDLVGPYEVLAAQPGVTAHFVAETLDPVRADSGLTVVPTTTFDALDRADLVVVPGGGGWARVLADGVVAAWLRKVHPTATWTTSVCSGSTLLAQAGILDGRPATTHWALRDELAKLGAVVSTDRVVVDGSVVTAAGVSAGIDMALTLTGLIWGDERAEFTQLVIEYDPRPPYDSGSPETASPELVAHARHVLTGS